MDFIVCMQHPHHHMLFRWTLLFVCSIHTTTCFFDGLYCLYAASTPPHAFSMDFIVCMQHLHHHMLFRWTLLFVCSIHTTTCFFDGLYCLYAVSTPPYAFSFLRTEGYCTWQIWSVNLYAIYDKGFICTARQSPEVQQNATMAGACTCKCGPLYIHHLCTWELSDSLGSFK